MVDEIIESIRGRNLALKNKLDRYRSDLEKGREPLTGGRWVTLKNGEHVYVRGGKVVAGAGGALSEDKKEAKSGGKASSSDSGKGIVVGKTTFLDYNGNKNKVVGEITTKSGKKLYKVEVNGNPSANLESASSIEAMIKREAVSKKEAEDREVNKKEVAKKEAESKAKKEAYSKKIAPISSGALDQGKKEKDLKKFVSINGIRGELHDVLDKIAGKISSSDVEFRDIKGKPHFSTDGSTYTPLHNRTGEKYFKHILKKKNSLKKSIDMVLSFKNNKR